MSDLRQSLAGNCIHPFNPLNQTNTADLPQDVAGTHLHHFHPLNQTDNSTDRVISSPEFDFWEAQEMNNNEAMGEFEVNTQNGFGFDAQSPPLWKTRKTINDEVYPPLLPCNHLYSSLSPKSRIQAILKGRKELMEMIQPIPESSYELSLKDIVDHNIMQNPGHDIKKEGMDCKTEVQVHHKMKVKKNTKTGSGQLYRSGSTSNNGFLLRMFFPTSLTTKNSRTGKCEKVTSRSSSLEPESRKYTEGSKKRFTITGQRSPGSSNCISISHAESSFFHCCWPSLHTKKSKIWRQRGCFS